jgi:hypothetical protein
MSEVVPFYRTNNMIYNVWFIGAPTLYFKTKPIL